MEEVELDICFREKKMGKRRGRLPNVRGRERMYAERLRISQTLGRRSSAFDKEEENGQGGEVEVYK